MDTSKAFICVDRQIIPLPLKFVNKRLSLGAHFNDRVGDSSSSVWSGGADDGKTTVVTAKDDYFMNVISKDILEAGATSTIQINFDSTDSVTISTENTGSKYYVLYITSIEFIVDTEA